MAGELRIATAAKEFDEKRRAWLNPSDLVVVEPESSRAIPTAFYRRIRRPRRCGRARSPTSTTSALPGSTTCIGSSTEPSPPPTAGRRTSAPTMRSHAS
jgi:hypothetical protein